MTDPTPEEIAEEARKIREGWTETERHRRLNKPKTRLGIKVIPTRDLSVSEELSEGLTGWNYLMPNEIGRQSKPAPKTSIEEEPHHEQLEREQFQAKPVNFGA